MAFDITITGTGGSGFDIAIGPTLAQGTTLAALQSGSANIKYTVAIEGYPRLLTDATAQQAVDAWSDEVDRHHYVQALGGLFVELHNEQQFDPWNPFTGGSRCTLKVVKSELNDTFGVDTHRRNAGNETELRATADRDAATITAATTTNFSSSGEAYIGTECFAYGSKTSTEFTAVERGQYAPFTCDPAGPVTGLGFAGHHRVGLGPLEVNLNPLVTSQPRVWIGKWVGVWMHKYDPTIPALNAKADALCVFAGRIVSISDDGAADCTIVELKHVLDVVADSSVGNRDPWTATVRESIKLEAKQRFRFRDYKNTNTNTNVTLTTKDTAEDLVVIASGASGANEVNEGFYTHVELFNIVNNWLRSEHQAGRIFGYYSLGFYTPDDGSRYVMFWWGQPSASSTEEVWFEFGMPESIQLRWGFNAAFSESVSQTNWSVMFLRSAAKFGSDLSAQVGDWPLRRQIVQFGKFNEIYFDDQQGTVFDQYDFIPSAFQVEDIYGAGEWGIFQIGNRLLIAGRYNSDGYLSEVQPLTGAFGFDSVREGDWTIFPDVGTADKITIRQIAILEMPFGAALKRVFKSTGTTSYNDNTYDSLGYGLGIAIPHELTDTAFMSSIDALPHADKPIVMVIDRPIKVADLFHGDLVLRRAFLRWKQGSLEFKTWQSPSSVNSVALLEEANKAAPAGDSDHHRVPSVENGTWARSVVKIRFNRLSNASGEDYRDSITIVDKTALDDHGGDGPTLTINARNTYGETAQAGAGIDAIAPGFLASMPLFSRPCRIISRSVDQRYFEGVAVGDVVTIEDAYGRDPDTGRRGVVVRYGILTKHWYTPGGLTPNAEQPNPQGGGADVFLMDLNRLAAYAPAAQVDDSASNAGYNAVTKVLTLYASKFSTSDVSYFAIGYKVRVIERDPSDPTSPLSWDDIIASKSGNTIALTTGLAGWDNTKTYYVTFDTYNDAVAAQKLLSYQADDADAMILDTRTPMMYGLGTMESSYTAWAAADDVELPPNAVYGDGVARDTAHDAALIRLTNNIINYKSANSSPLLYNDELNTATWAFVPAGTTYRLVSCEPVHLSEEILLNDVWRRLHVAPFMKSSDGSVATVRVTLSRTPPSFDADIYDAHRGFIISEATFTTSSTTYAVASSDVLVCNIKDGGGNAWLYIETSEKARTRGLSLCQEGPRLY